MLKFNYESPLELPEDITLNPRVIEINGIKWQARSDCKYKHDYYAIFDRAQRANAMSKEQKKANPLENEINIYRNYLKWDLWMFVYFVMKNPLANHPFIVEACKEVEDDKGETLHVWARDHLKSSIITIGRTCHKIINNPEKRIAIISAVRPLAVRFQNTIKKIFEMNFMYQCFPDILYRFPHKEADKWTEAPEGGLIVKRNGIYPDPTISSWGLIEGLPTGAHYTDIVFDDIVTQDTQSPEIMSKVKENFDMAANLGTRDCQRTVVGTYYRHDDPLVYIGELKDPETGEPTFKINKKPGTVGGEFNGKAVFSSEAALKKKRAGNRRIFYCQVLLNPTPKGTEKLNYENLQTVTKRELPDRMYRFMVVDGSGDQGRRADRAADCWAFGVFGVVPYLDDKGFSDIYILDLKIEEMSLETAQKEIVEMYCRNGRILKLGVEKVGQSTTEIHISNALKAKRRIVSVDRGNLQILKPGSRSKEFRIESSLAPPLNGGKWHILNTISASAEARLKLEMEKFPAWKDDGLDICSYVYDIIKEYRFGVQADQEADGKKRDRYDEAFAKARENRTGGGFSWYRV